MKKKEIQKFVESLSPEEAAELLKLVKAMRQVKDGNVDGVMVVFL